MNMVVRLTLTLSLVLTLTSLTLAQTDQCNPGNNCDPPDCRCWNDDTVPGGLDVADTPQVVLVSFEYAINEANFDQYVGIFGDTKNPNNCPAVGTFFVQQTGSRPAMIKQLRDAGHEIGVTTLDGTTPETEEQWVSNLRQMKQFVVEAGVPEQDVVGVRAPQLMPGGLFEFTALAQEGYLYDSSCSTIRNSGVELLWPYTYDYAPGPSCDNGEGPEAEFPGRWQVMVADLEFQGTKCATPQACTAVTTDRDAFDLFYESFLKHYEGNRSPFLIVINPEWALTPFKQEGTRQFVEYVRAAFPDVWVLSTRQALEWVRNPVSNANATNGYQPWAC